MVFDMINVDLELQYFFIIYILLLILMVLVVVCLDGIGFILVYLLFFGEYLYVLLFLVEVQVFELLDELLKV